MLGGGFFAFGMGAFFLSLEQEFSQGSRGLLSLVIGIAPLQGAILGPIQGYMVDRFGPRRIMLIGVTLNGVGWILISTADSLGVFLVFFLLVAAGNGMGLVSPPLATVGNWFIKKRGLAFGVATAGFSMGSVLVPLVNFFIESFDWRGAAVIIGVIVLVVGLPISLVMRHRPEDYGLLPDGEPAAPNPALGVASPAPIGVDFTAREALATKAFWLMYVNFGIRALIISAVSIHFIAALVDKEFSRATAANLLALLGIMSFPSRLGAGILADRMDKRYLGALATGILGLSMLSLIWATSLWQLVLFVAVYSVAIGGSGTNQFAIRAEYFGRKAFATISGFGAIVMAAGALLGTWLAGFVFDRTESYNGAFAIYAGLSLVSILAILLAKRPVHTSLRKIRRQVS